MTLAVAAQGQHAKFKLLDGLLGDESDSSEAPYSEDEKFVHPLTGPYGHEDSFVTTDARAWFAYQDFGSSAQAFGSPSSVIGGNAKLYALQLRVALTDQIQFVAYKDGYTDMHTSLTKKNGWNDIAAGIKYNFLQDWENQMHAAVGVGYELAVGDAKILHNDDEVRVWGSFNKGFGKLHLGTTVNYYWVPEKDRTASSFGDSDHMSWHLHADYRVCDWWSPVLEMNGYHVMDDTNGLPIQGVDLVNLGGDTADSVILLGIGSEFRPTESIGIRGAYEMPINETDGLFNYRWTFSTVFSF